MLSIPKNERESVERQLAELKTLRKEKRVARQRLKVVGLIGASILVLLAGAAMVLGDMLEEGVSPRSPLYWFVGLMGIAVIPFGLYLIRGTRGETLSLSQLDMVIAQVEHDLEAEAKIAPTASLQVVEPGMEGALSEAKPISGE